MAKDSAYETFDSAGGPTNKGAGDSAHDDKPSDQGVTQGAVPEMPQSK